MEKTDIDKCILVVGDMLGLSPKIMSEIIADSKGIEIELDHIEDTITERFEGYDSKGIFAGMLFLRELL